MSLTQSKNREPPRKLAGLHDHIIKIDELLRLASFNPATCADVLVRNAVLSAASKLDLPTNVLYVKISASILNRYHAIVSAEHPSGDLTLHIYDILTNKLTMMFKNKKCGQVETESIFIDKISGTIIYLWG